MPKSRHSEKDLRRVRGVREHIGDDVPLMVDANQQWDRTTALRMGHRLEEFDLTWIEEPLDAYHFEGHARLSRTLVANERLDTEDGRMLVPDRPGLGITLSEQARAWTTESASFGKR